MPRSLAICQDGVHDKHQGKPRYISVHLSGAAEKIISQNFLRSLKSA